jgi:hypothetical protein
MKIEFTMEAGGWQGQPSFEFNAAASPPSLPYFQKGSAFFINAFFFLWIPQRKSNG